MINYHDKKFKIESVSSNGEVGNEVIFHYYQKGDVVHCTYKGNGISYGHLLGIVNPEGHIDMRYHQVNSNGKLMTGICHSVPEIDAKGKIKLHEKWKWTSGDMSEGTSTLREL